MEYLFLQPWFYWVLLAAIFICVEVIFGYICWRAGWVEGYVLGVADTIKHYHLFRRD